MNPRDRNKNRNIKFTDEFFHYEPDSTVLKVNFATADDMFILVDYINKRPKIETLILRKFARFTKDDFTLIFQRLTRIVENTKINSLVLRDCEVGDDCIIALAKGLANNKTIISVDFSKNDISETGMAALLIGLSHNYTISSINFDESIDDDTSDISINALNGIFLRNMFLPFLHAMTFGLGRDEMSSAISKLPKEVINTILHKLHALLLQNKKISQNVTPHLFIEHVQQPMENRISTRARANESHRLFNHAKQEAEQLGIFKEGSPILRKKVCLNIMDKLFDNITGLNNKAVMNKEITNLLRIFERIQTNTTHIVHYQLAQMIAATIKTRNDIEQSQPENKIQLDQFINTAIKSSGFQKEKLDKIQNELLSENEMKISFK